MAWKSHTKFQFQKKMRNIYEKQKTSQKPFGQAWHQIHFEHCTQFSKIKSSYLISLRVFQNFGPPLNSAPGFQKLKAPIQSLTCNTVRILYPWTFEQCTPFPKIKSSYPTPTNSSESRTIQNFGKFLENQNKENNVHE